MANTIPIYRRASKWSEGQLLALPPCTLSADWAGVSVAPPVQMIVAIDSDELFLLGRGSGEKPAPKFQTNFIEGLWEYDLVELFIKRGDQYQEFNLALNGEAWWSMGFDSYRSRSGPLNTGGAVDTVKGWARLRVKRSELLIDPGMPVPGIAALGLGASGSTEIVGETLLTPQALPVTAHLSAYINRNGATSFLSSAPIPGIAPDYHRPECFLPVTLREK